jgi:hypothetical protein
MHEVQFRSRSTSDTYSTDSIYCTFICMKIYNVIQYSTNTKTFKTVECRFAYLKIAIAACFIG